MGRIVFRHRILSVLALASFICLTGYGMQPQSAPQASSAPTRGYIINRSRQTVQDHRRTVKSWERASYTGLGIVIALAVLGGATAVFQGIKRKWSKPATVGAGALVTALTLFSTTALPADYKTLSRRAFEGSNLIDSMDGWIKTMEGATTDTDFNDALGEFTKREVRLANLEAEATRQGQGGGVGPGVVLYAQEQGCVCLKPRPNGSGFQYFCGTATGQTMSDARRAATATAYRRLESSLSQNVNAAQQQTINTPQQNDSVRAYAATVASEVDSCAITSPQGILFAVLLRVPTSLFARPSIDTFRLPQSQVAQVAMTHLRVTLQKIFVEADGSGFTTQWTFAVDSNGKPLFALGSRKYDDRRGHNQVVLRAEDRAVGTADVPVGGHVIVTVRGHRVTNADVATGSTDISGPGAFQVRVRRNAKNRQGGSFVFFFSADAAT